MKGKRIFVAVVFIVLVFGLLVDFKPLLAQGPCGECGTPVGVREECPGSAPVETGELAGNCLWIDSVAKTDANMQPVTCMRVSFYDCNYAKADAGCALGSGCPLNQPF